MGDRTPQLFRGKFAVRDAVNCFPKMTFMKFYLSGLDEHGIFNPGKADRTLLYNAEHPDPADSLHMFGVDDGEGMLTAKTGGVS